MSIGCSAFPVSALARRMSESRGSSGSGPSSLGRWILGLWILIRRIAFPPCLEPVPNAIMAPATCEVVWERCRIVPRRAPPSGRGAESSGAQDNRRVLLERLFENLSLRVEPFAMCEVSSGWRLSMDERDWVTFHFVLRGHGALRVGRGPLMPLAPHTVAIVPERRRHAIQSDDASPHEAFARGHPTDAAGLDHFIAGSEGDRELLFACGRVEALYAGGLGLFNLLDEPIVLDFSHSERMKATFTSLLEESEDLSAGSGAMLTALISECLVMIFRRLEDSPQCRLPWLNALGDPRMAGVLDAVLKNPERDYSIEILAELALMSRSAFAQEFAACFGRTPMAYVRDVRLRRGADLLRGTTLSVAAVASQVGFASRSHFSHAFREYFGHSPAEFRLGPLTTHGLSGMSLIPQEPGSDRRRRHLADRGRHVSPS